MKLIITLTIMASIIFGIGTTANAQHIVRPGESLSKISKQYNMGLKDLILLNPHIEDPNIIHVNDYIIIRSKDNTKKDMVDYAKSLQAVTAYSYGGTKAPYSTDCSGWMQFVLKKFGVDIPRVSRDQAKTGTPVTFKQLQLGDLMFFSTHPDKKTITHVGLYMGNDLWISNLNEKVDVEIMPTFNSWTQKYFMWGARYKM